jgi:hypothetical protein
MTIKIDVLGDFTNTAQANASGEGEQNAQIHGDERNKKAIGSH